MAEEFLSDNDFALGVEDFDSEEEYKIYCLRHSTSHIMAAAVQQVFPEAQFGIGPPVKNGFYYDMDLSRPLTPEDLEEIERRMRDIVKANQEFYQQTWDKEKALEFFGAKHQTYKLELIRGIDSPTVST
jgi:threonyl-tRNA synthetase